MFRDFNVSSVDTGGIPESLEGELESLGFAPGVAIPTGIGEM